MILLSLQEYLGSVPTHPQPTLDVATPVNVRHLFWLISKGFLDGFNLLFLMADAAGIFSFASLPVLQFLLLLNCSWKSLLTFEPDYLLLSLYSKLCIFQTKVPWQIFVL